MENIWLYQEVTELNLRFKKVTEYQVKLRQAFYLQVQ